MSYEKRDGKRGIFVMFIALMLLAGSVQAQSSGASTMTLSPERLTAKVGETFDLSVQVHPNGEELDTARAILTFTPTILEVQDVVLTGAFDRVSPGNAVENSQGILSYGGFTLEGPVTESTEFARVTFRVVAQGEGAINVSADSRLISNGEEKINVAALGEASVTIVPEESGISGSVNIESSSHPDQEAWYANPIAELTWSVQGGEVEEYLFALDQSSSTSPTQPLPATTNLYTTQELADGIWYVHVRSIFSNGDLTPTTHRVIRVDRTPPNPLVIDLTSDQILETESLQAFFGTTDETSGVDRYELSFSGSAYAIVESPQTLQAVPPGTYVLQIRAVDQAGNETYAQTVFRSYPEGTVLPTQPVVGSQEAGKRGMRELLITLSLGILLVVGIIISHYMSKKKKT